MGRTAYAPIPELKFSARTTVAVGATSTLVLSANINRRGGVINNEDLGVGTCWIAFEGEDPVANKDLELKSGATLILDNTLPITGEIRAICAAGQSTNLISQEAT